MLCMIVVTGTAGAQPAGPSPATTDVHARAAALFAEGRALLAAHEPAEACDRFARSLELEADDLGVMLNLGLCNEQLDKLATALKWFRRAQVRASAVGLAASEHAAQDKTSALALTVPTVRIELPPRLEGAAVTVDGAPVDEGDLGRLELDAGHHVIVAVAPGTAALRAEIDVGDGQNRVVELAASAPVAAHEPPPAPVPPPRRPAVAVVAPAARPASTHAAAHARRWPVYAVGATGAVLIAGSIALGVAGHYAADATDHPDVQRQWQGTLRYGGTSMFVVGTALVGWATWTLLRARHEQPGQTVVAPAVGSAMLGMAVTGGF